MIFASLAAMGIRRIEAGILDNISDFDISMTPFAAGLGQFIDLDKKDFIGRSALLQADRQTLLYGLKCRSATPAGGATIADAGSSVGTVTASAWSPDLDCGIGYVRFNEAGDWVGKTMSMQTR
ncbi:MAG: glycine cleavage system aminomethyltransferase T [Planctomycetota bacterium]|jgi:glycine cleavage system aminomethyltransferase T